MPNQKAAIKGVIFDCDGTLVDSETLSTELIVDMLQERGHKTSYEEIFSLFRGEKFSIFIDKVKENYSNLEPEDFIAEYRERSTHLLETKLQEIDGASNLLKKLDIEKCIASNGPRHKIETSLKTTQLISYFQDKIISAYEVNSWKPDPTIILCAANLLRTAPSNCLLIDDSMAGVEAGLKANVQVVAFRISNKTLGKYKNLVRQIEDLSQILEIVYPN